jgi:acyl-CoA synthetase (NDP forming)
MTAGQRGVYRHKEMERLFNPKSIAVFGVSPNPTSLGARSLDQLDNTPGSTVNPVRTHRHPCYLSIAALPEVPDCAIVALPRVAVDAALVECGQGGVGGAIVFARYLEPASRKTSRCSSTRPGSPRDRPQDHGPNCLGFVNLPARGRLPFRVPSSAACLERGVGLVSQSGAMGFAWRNRRGVACRSATCWPPQCL